jgi:hypothetical protein
MWLMYETWHSDEEEGRINSQCGRTLYVSGLPEEIIFWNMAVDQSIGV